MSASEKKTIDEVTLPTAELRVHIQRCERLLQHPELLERLQDKGASIKERLERFSGELSRRDASVKAHANSSAEKLNTRAGNDEEKLAEVKVLSQAEDQRQIAEKYKDRRVPVEEIVRRAYGGSLSEKEIQRILADVPPNFFLTYTETLAMQTAAAKEARKEELRRLRAQSD